MELSVAMPLSWLPVISDYTREAEKPVRATAVSVIVYGLVSCWMYIIGMGAAIFTGETDIAAIMVKAGLGIAGLLIIIFSTVTTHSWMPIPPVCPLNPFSRNGRENRWELQ